MRQIKYVVQRKLMPFFWGLTACFVATTTYADKWFPESMVNKNSANKEGMTLLSENVVRGSQLLFFILCVGAFFKCVMTISHGIEEAKKNEGGLMAVFGSYAVMSFVYLTISITCGYLGYTMTTKFSL